MRNERICLVNKMKRAKLAQLFRNVNYEKDINNMSSDRANELQKLKKKHSKKLKLVEGKKIKKEEKEANLKVP